MIVFCVLHLGVDELVQQYLEFTLHNLSPLFYMNTSNLKLKCTCIQQGQLHSIQTSQYFRVSKTAKCVKIIRTQLLISLNEAVL